MRMPATALAILALLAGCSQAATTPSPLPAPALAVSQYFADLAAHDCQAAYTLLTDPLRTRVVSEDQFCIDSAASPNRSVVVNATHALSGATAVVTATVVKTDGSSRQDDVTVVLSGGVWKLSNIAAHASNGGTLFDLDAALGQIRMEYQQQTGYAVTMLTCKQLHGSISVVAGQMIVCVYTDAAQTAGTLTITIGADGGYTWATSNPSREPSPLPT